MAVGDLRTKQRAMKTTSLMLCLTVGLGALASAGCATMGVGPALVTDVPKGVEHRPIPSGSSDGVVTQDGLRVSVRVAEHCNVLRVDKIERTTIRKHQNLTPQNDWWAGIGGALLITAGAVAIAKPATMQPEDGSASLEEVRGGGYAMVGLGALLAAVPVIDYVRANREAQHTVERVEEPGPLVQHDVRCGAPPEGTELTSRDPEGRTISLGRTDPRGVVSANLDEVVPAAWAFSKDARLVVHLGDRPLGEVALDDLYVHREAAAWQLAESNACRTSLDVSACDAQAAYLRRFPDGAHAAEARQWVDDAGGRRRVAADEAAWASLEPRACRTPAKNDPAVIEEACAPIEQYLAEYPDGLHAEAARDALRPAKAILARLEEAEARRAYVAAASTVSPGAFIPYAGNGGGPTPCADGTWSHSSGRGTCSHHGGIAGGSSRRSGGGHYSSGGSRGGGHRRSFGGSRRK